jgi:endo-1,4-beta-D-glucanase Y
MLKKFLHLAACILAVFAVVAACSSPSGNDTVIYAYFVSFDKNHNESDMDRYTEANPQTKIVITPATTVGSLPANPTLHSMKFAGWNTAKDGKGTAFTASTPVMSDITVYAKWNPPGIAVELNINGNVDEDIVTLSTSSGDVGDPVIISYTLANTEINNRLAFSGVSLGIDMVNEPGSGIRTYTISKADAVDDTITINATFTHSDLIIDTIDFGGPEDKTYGDSKFTRGLAHIGAGSGAVTYSSSDITVATVNETTGEVTIAGAGTSTIKAEKASDGEYEKTQAEYMLNVAQKQLTIGNPSVTTIKTYNGTNTAEVFPGALGGIVGGDTVSVSAAATYNSANVKEANLITVAYSIEGSSAHNYKKPADYEIGGTITKASGIEVASPPIAASTTSASITLTPVILVNISTSQTVEYARAVAATPVPASGWQDSTTFNGLQADTAYFFFARAKENDNYEAGTVKTSATAITTQKKVFTVMLNISGAIAGDSVTLTPTPASGTAGTTVTINYTLASSGDANNRLAFSNVTPAIDPVVTPGTSTKTYAINEVDALDGTITINAEFTHTDLSINTIAFTGAHEDRIYGDSLTKTLSNTGNGSGAITYSSSDNAVATVTNAGVVTMLKNGTATITAAKASDSTYALATASYTLNVAQRQLTIANPSVTTTKSYVAGNTSATVTAGALTNKVGNDAVTISASATYNSANVAEASLITVVYTMTGNDAEKYFKPANYTIAGTITKATGIGMSTQTNLTAATITQTSVTLNTLALTGGSNVQTVEYAYATTDSTPSTGWKDDRTFSGLTPNTTYYFFARSKENANYNAGTAKASSPIKTPNITLNVTVNKIGTNSGDNVSVSPTSGSPGDTANISYTLARTGTAKNDLVFSNATIASVSAPGSSNTAATGTRPYIINEADAVSGTITINAVFTHVDLLSNTIAFTGTTESRIYDSATFTKTITTNGNGSGAVTYSSSDTSIATVSNSGVVTMLKNGNATITATKASDGTYMEAKATYTLTIAQRQLTKTNPTVTATKAYDGNTTAAVTTVGALNNVVSGDTVSVTAAANYNTADAGTGKTITVVYTIAGADMGKYIKPVNYTATNGTINKATGSALNANPSAASTTSTSVTLTAATLSAATGQSVEYNRASNTTVPTTGWQDSTSFTGLTANTQYYFFARSKENTNYSAGAVRTSAAIRTPAASEPPVPPIIVDFEKDTVGKKYEYTQGDNSPTRVEVTADPARSGQKSLRVTTNASGNKAYNQAAVIPINLPYALNNYKSFSFRFYPASGTSTGQIMVYAAGSTGTFVKWGFGNPASGSNQFAANLVGQTPNVSFSSTGSWIDYNITITSPGSAISNLKGDIFIAIGINDETSLDYYLDDLTFTIKDGFKPPVVPGAPSPPSVGAVTSGNYRNLFKELGKTDAEINAKVNTTWNRLFTGDETYRIYNPVGSDMAYILDSGHDNPDVRSEGMSYGMMMAVQMDKKNEFNRLWKWAKTYMYNESNRGKNGRGYFAWQVNPNGSIIDAGCAPDGEFYFVTALLFAHARWGSESGATNLLNYRQHAMQLLYDMIHRDTAKGDNNNEPPMFRDTDYNGHGKYMTTFQPQGSAGQFTDPSYHLPAFYEVWAIEMERDANDNILHGIWSNAAAMKADVEFYRNAVKASREFFPKTTNGTTGLGPDYARFDGVATGNQPYFEYDAFRIAMNIAMDWSWFAADAWQKTFADRIQTFFQSKGVTSYTALWELNGTPRPKPGDHSPGLVACNAVVSLAASNQRAWEFLDDFWEISMTPGQYRYYDGCLYMLGLLHVTGNFKAYLSGGGNYVPSSSIDPTSATFDKRSDLQKDITVTMNLNGNTLSNIRNGATTLTSGSTGNYTLSNSNTTVTLRSAYLATLPIGTTTLTFTFSAGSARTIAITVRETPAGGTPSGGTSFDFSTLTNSDVTIAYQSTNISATITEGALRITNSGSYNGAGVILTLNLGSQTLGSFSGIKLTYRGVSGDTNSKSFIVEVPNTAGGTFNNLGNNTRLIEQSVSGNSTVTYNKINFASGASSALSRTGELKILLGLYNTGVVAYDVILIELVP